MAKNSLKNVKWQEKFKLCFEWGSAYNVPFYAMFCRDLRKKLKVDFIVPPIFEEVELIKSIFEMQLTIRQTLLFLKTYSTFVIGEYGFWNR